MKIREMSYCAIGALSLAVSPLVVGLVGGPPAKGEPLVGGPPARSPLFAVLLGGNEVNIDGRANVGDPDGRGSATIILPSPRRLCFAILVTDIGTPVSANLHNALAGNNGPLVVPLAAPNNGIAGASSGCRTGLDRALVTAIRNGPGAFAVSVSTEEFPDGALRGNLF